MVPNKQYYVYMRYSIINEYFKNALPKTVKDSIEQMGYELYDKQIVSNRVPLILKNKVN
jgi:ribosome maturation factor RimP